MTNCKYYFYTNVLRTLSMLLPLFIFYSLFFCLCFSYYSLICTPYPDILWYAIIKNHGQFCKVLKLFSHYTTINSSLQMLCQIPCVCKGWFHSMLWKWRKRRDFSSSVRRSEPRLHHGIESVSKTRLAVVITVIFILLWLLNLSWGPARINSYLKHHSRLQQMFRKLIDDLWPNSKICGIFLWNCGKGEFANTTSPIFLC